MGPIADFDFDVAILFSDILFPLESLGMNLSYDPGPKFSELLTEENYKKLFNQPFPIQSLDFQAEAIERTIEKLPKDKSMIGFVGGPWTLLSYAMGTNKERYMEDLSEFEWSIVKNELIPLLKENISIQIKAGAEIIMIFDSAANQLNSADFDKYIRLVFKEIVLNFNNKVGYYAKDGVDYLLIENIKNELSVPLAGLGIDSSESITDFFRSSRQGFIQGNFNQGSMAKNHEDFKKDFDKYVDHLKIIDEKDRLGWVCGLGHGILKETPEENVHYFIENIRKIFS